MNSLRLFLILQLADVLTTMLCFRIGLHEMNPVTAWFILGCGTTLGLFAAKLPPCLIVLRVERLRWVANVAYMLIIGWNLFLFGVIGTANALTPHL